MTTLRTVSFFAKDADLDGITATYDAGVLTVEIVKTEESKPRQISVG